MKLNLATGLICLLASTEAVAASSWWSKAIYNKWHETELERWLSDHNIPHPSPADRRDLENLVKTNWDNKVQKPLGQAADNFNHELHHAREWIFDSWSDSQLKAFLDRHGIPAPQPRRRDLLIKTARENYEMVATKVGEAASYPGDWLYSEWSDSDLKEWLDERGWPVPQPTTRDQLIASVRRNSRIISLQSQSVAASASAEAEAAKETLSDQLFNAWSDSKLKEFLDEHNVKVPQGSKRNELIALARKNRHYLSGQVASASSAVEDAFGAATTKAGNEYARATDFAKLKIEDAFETALSGWSNSRLKAFLDARGIPVPQNSKRDELTAKVRANAHKAAGGWNQYNFDTWDKEHLLKYLSSVNHKAVEQIDASREELIKQAQDYYTKASQAGGEQLASATAALAQATGTAKDSTFDQWSQSELKRYLDNYGVPTYQGSNINELRAAARRNAQYFKYGTTNPQQTIYSRIMDTVHWVMEQLKIGAASGRAQGTEAAEKVQKKVAEQTERVREEL
ncbi:Stress-responsive protein Ish1 [Penicillium coprophilum]|uniref:Stress-responsive protein Ish1 n=1 Tax=Penicillium coprophilum TaxID=36646 RepID=UPI0023914E86|nr:Stress-responsive protein Ish1 [Penicillium coprophilum]KAJ5158458.1 Stress-responsive protein Ish1 [Penicillium coprophilum]